MIRRRREQGFSLVELAMTTMMVSGALVGMGATVLGAVRLESTVTEKREAAWALQSLTEQVRATPFDDLAATWSDLETDAVVGGGTTTARFDVVEIGPSANAPVFQVRIRLADPRDSTSDIASSTIYVSRDSPIAATAAQGAGQ